MTISTAFATFLIDRIQSVYFIFGNKCADVPTVLRSYILRLRYSTTIRLGLSQILHALSYNSEGHLGVNVFAFDSGNSSVGI